MKRLFTLALGLFAVVSVQAQSLLVGTYNVRYQNEADTQHGNGWGQRCPVICELLAYESPDIFGTQEAKVGQIHDLLKGLPEYDYIGIGRDDGHEEGEYSAIFYHKTRLKKVRSGNFWLSETPDRPALGWDAACIRICTWGEFEDRKTHRRLYFFNLHLDHVGRKARTESARLVLSRIRTLAPKGAAVILTGDFNVDQNDEIYTLLTSSSLLRDSYAIAERRLAPNGTFNAFDTELKTRAVLIISSSRLPSVSRAMPCVPIATGRSARMPRSRGAIKLPPKCVSRSTYAVLLPITIPSLPA